MQAIKIKPQHLKGEIEIPPSKSMAHRAIICAALAKGISKIEHIEYSQDVIATIEALRSLGTEIKQYDDCVVIDGTNTFTHQKMTIDCNESGSTLRFIIPISLVKKTCVNFIGRGNLGQRPLDIFYTIFNRQNIHYQYQKDCLNLNIEGKLLPDVFEIPGNVSSQFISGLLFALPLLEKDSVIKITSPLESRGYIDLTLEMLSRFGIVIENNNYQEFLIKGNQQYLPCNYYVEADFSQAAFYLVAGALGNDLIIKGLNMDSKQGDKEVLTILESMGASICKVENGLKVCCHQLQATNIDGSQYPDIIPILSLAACLAKGKTIIYNAQRLRIKECDRLKAVATELGKLGANITEQEDGLIIQGVDALHGNSVSSWNDHRIAMTLAIASTCMKEPLVIDNKECVKKSYPNFFEDFIKLGGLCDEC